MNEPVFDDSALIHRAAYDPAKAREYYLRTRHLKGRHKGVVLDKTARAVAQPVGGGHLRPSRREHLLAEKAALEKRLETLKNALQLLVDQAKRRSGVKVKPKHQTPAEQAKAKAAQKKADSNLSPAEKAKKREASKKAYAKENHTTLAQDVTELHKQIADYRAKIEQAVKDARAAAARTNHQTASKGR